MHNIHDHLSAARARTNLVRNLNKACRASGCSLPRKGFSVWCPRHLPAAKRLGHPDARALRPTEYREQENMVEDLFRCHPDHPGLVYVLQTLDAWLQEATSAEALPANRWPHKSVAEVARLVRYGVTSRALLVRLCAVFAFLRSTPSVLPSDEARWAAISHAVFKLAPRPRRESRTHRSRWVVLPKAAAVAHLGRHLTESFAPFLEVVAQGLDQREQQRANVQQALRQPFGVPAAAILTEGAGK